MLNEEVNKKNKTKIDLNVIKKFFNENKKTILIGLGALIVVILLIVGGVSLFYKKDKTNNSEVLENRLRELAKEFYEVKYYPNLINSDNEVMSDEEKKSFIERFKETGITIDLNSLARLFGEKKDEILAEFKNKDEACNYDNTKIVIKPKEPYEIKSYDVEVNLDCGF